MGMMEKKKSGLPDDPSHDAEPDSAAIGDLSSVASKMDYIDAALGVLNDPTRKLPPVGQAPQPSRRESDIMREKNKMASADHVAAPQVSPPQVTPPQGPSSSQPASSPPVSAMSEKTAAALNRFQAALGKTAMMDAKAATSTQEPETRKTRAEPRKLKRAFELQPEVSLKEIIAEKPEAAKLPERTLKDLSAEFENSFTKKQDDDKTDESGVEKAESEVLKPAVQPEADLEAAAPATQSAVTPQTSATEPASTRSTPEPSKPATPIEPPVAPARKTHRLEVETASEPSAKPSQRPKPLQRTVQPVEKAPPPEAAKPEDLVEVDRFEERFREPDLPPVHAEISKQVDTPREVSLQDAVHELELGDLHGRDPDFTYLRHTIRKLQYRFMATQDVELEVRDDFETILKTLSVASVQYRMMREKQDELDSIVESRDLNAGRLRETEVAIKERDQKIGKLMSQIENLKRDNTVTGEKHETELENLRNSSNAKFEAMKFDLERAKEHERKAKARLEEAAERLLESETRLEESAHAIATMEDKTALAQAESEVLRNSLDEACEKIVVITSGNMQSEMRIQQLEDELAELQSR